jgi:phosphonate transport system substrate-binding protein
MYRMFTPLLQAVERAMEKRVGSTVDIQLRIFKTYELARVALAKGDVDFVRFGPASYVMAKRETPRIQLLAMETVDGHKTFKGYIVVLEGSEIRKIADLRDKRFAFGDCTSTIGCYLAQQKLVDAGLRAADLAGHEFLGRHDKVFRAVQLGGYDAGALKSSTFDQLNSKSRPESRLRVLVDFDNVTKPWVGRADLPRSIVQALQASLLSIRAADALGALEADALVEATDEHYDIIRKSMAAAERFAPTLAKPPEVPAPAAEPARVPPPAAKPARVPAPAAKPQKAPPPVAGPSK